MKKFVFKATALAIGALVGGSAFATITLSDTTADANTYATELVADGDALSDVNLAAKTKIGFGIAQTATRFVRFDLTNAKWNANIVAGNLDAETAAAAALAPSVSVAQGGTTADNYVIFQVQANDASYQQDAVWLLALDAIGVKVTSTGSAVGLTYAMYETAEKAVANVSSTKLAGYSENVAEFGAGLKFSVTPNDQTASVEQAFKKFSTTATPAAVSATIAYLGKVVADVNTTKTAAGAAVLLSDLIDNGTKVKVTGDFGAKAGNGVWLAPTSACAAVTYAGVFATGNTTLATITTDSNVLGHHLCYEVNGTTAVPEQTPSVAYDLVADAASTTTDPAAKSAGKVLHDGTTLQAPFATIHPDYLSRVVLTSTYSVDAAVAASVILENGNTCGTGTTSFTVPAGKMLVVNTKDICPSITAGATRLAVKLDIVAPSNSISGVYNVMNYDQVTGKTNSLISYPMLRPGTN